MYDLKKNKKLILKAGLLITPFILLVSLIALSAVYDKPTVMDIKVYGLDGNPIFTRDFKGNILIVEFMATWCTVCKQITKNIATLLSTNDLSDVVFFSITTDPVHDTPEVLNDYIEENDISTYVENGQWVFARDLDSVKELFKVTGVPETYLVDQNLNIANFHIGSLGKAEIMEWIFSLRE
ncbi:MAG: Thiol-disulfide oxidoreductase ResA [Candidatus Heimdallarchaeota archaeon LC_3]|nr:MAG: Thiol-disulfide oxidoreductase ResA [Candidatus Heimdallarchaeota archaeon LC_3]